MKRPGETAGVKVTAIFGDGAVARRHARSARSKQCAGCGGGRADESVVQGARVGEATLLVRYQGEFGDGAGDRAEPEAGFRVEAAAAEQLHRPPDRRQAAAAEDPAVGPDRRCDVSPPGVARSDRRLPTPEKSARFSPTRSRSRSAQGDRQADREPRLRRSLDAASGPTCCRTQPQVPRRKGRVRVPRMDSRVSRARTSPTTASCARC